MWMCDYVVDGPFEVEHRDISLAFRGSPNQRIIDIKKTLAEKHVIELDVDKED
jgi:anaerobic ribonucleoside-triphosphate reductase activating protein